MEQGKNPIDLQEGFKERTGGVASNWRSSKLPERSYQYFGLSRGQDVALRVKLLFRNGERFSFSYALLPVISFSPNDGLLIRITEYDVSVTGRGLQILEEYLSGEQVTWIKESPSGRDDGDDEVFIEHINLIDRED